MNADDKNHTTAAAVAKELEAACRAVKKPAAASKQHVFSSPKPRPKPTYGSSK